MYYVGYGVLSAWDAMNKDSRRDGWRFIYVWLSLSWHYGVLRIRIDFKVVNRIVELCRLVPGPLVETSVRHSLLVLDGFL